MKLCVCDKCNATENSKKVVSFKMKDRGYGSEFDSMEFEFELCEDCAKELGVKEEWFDNELNEIYELHRDDCDQVCYNKFVFGYQNENNIINVINSLPIEVQERLLNRPTLCCPFVMDSEEWIKMYKDGYFNL